MRFPLHTHVNANKDRQDNDDRMTTAMMVDSLLLENCLVDRSWVVFMVDGSREGDVTFVVSGALDIDP